MIYFKKNIVLIFRNPLFYGNVKGKVKQRHYRPGQAQRVQGGWVFQIMTVAHEGGKVVSLTHRPPLPPGNNPGNHFC